MTFTMKKTANQPMNISLGNIGKRWVLLGTLGLAMLPVGIAHGSGFVISGITQATGATGTTVVLQADLLNGLMPVNGQAINFRTMLEPKAKMV